MFTSNELNMLLEVLGRVQITGREATAVALLQQKISNMLAEPKDPKQGTNVTPTSGAGNKKK